MSARASMGRATRARYGLEVALALLLAVAAAVLATELADWRYVRFDLSERGRNTVDPATLERLDHLPETLEIHTFLRPLAAPYDRVSGAALRRVADFLFLVQTARRDAVRLVHHDMADLAGAREAERELGVEGENLVVLRLGQRRMGFDVFGEAVAVDWGNPSLDSIKYLTERGIPNVIDPRKWDARLADPDSPAYVPPRLVESRVEAVFAAAVARVSVEDSPHVYVSTGHGEPGIDQTLPGSVSALARELSIDGFTVAAWDPAAGAVPADCDVLAVLGPRQALEGSALGRVQAYLERGGRAIVTLGEEAPDLLDDLLQGYGLGIQPGIVCEPVRGDSGAEVEGVPQCAFLSVGARGLSEGHPVTDLLRRNGLRLALAYTAAFERGAVPGGGETLDLVHSTPEAWRDLRDPSTGRYNYALDQTQGERVGTATLAALVQRRTPAGSEPPGELRLLAVGSTAFLADQNFAQNRAFVRAAFNWMAEREARIDVAPRAEDRTALDVERGRSLGILSTTLWLGLPGASILVGALVGWRRRR